MKYDMEQPVSLKTSVHLKYPVDFSAAKSNCCTEYIKTMKTKQDSTTNESYDSREICVVNIIHIIYI